MRGEGGTSAGPTYLAFDTSGAGGSIALGCGGAILASGWVSQAQEQAARLIPAIEKVLAAAGVARMQLDGIVVGEGPGSFTGVRVAAATAKGLAHALSIPLWAVSSLAGAALAQSVGPIRYVLFDARGDRVYGACYGVGRSGFQELVAPHGGTLWEALDGDVPGGAVFVGDASWRHRAAIEGAGFTVAPEPDDDVTAQGLLRCLALHPDSAPVERAADWEPRYVRASSAERLWTM
jgi:tRNA threonylcarbamoyladenosine biosynthesis protein TsaB